ncbi:MAG: hypothetical protein LBD74_00640, partial [Spirochaetaceae bacterium]|nr:hypothetical protein [Spirochaetaceae bacterium]
MRKKSLLLGTAAGIALLVALWAGCKVETGDGDRVSSVTLSPATAVVARGGARQFTATVAVEGSGLARTVTWAVEGTAALKAGTTISADGVLTVAKDENLTVLTVKAASTADPSKTGEAAVRVVVAVDAAIRIGFEGEPTVSGAAAGIVLSKTGAGGKPKTLALSATGYESPTWYVDGAETGT